MSTFGLVYIIGSITSFIIVLYCLIKDEDIITLQDLLFVSYISSLGSWFTLIFLVLITYKDKVIFKRKRTYDN